MPPAIIVISGDRQSIGQSPEDDACKSQEGPLNGHDVYGEVQPMARINATELRSEFPRRPKRDDESRLGNRTKRLLTWRTSMAYLHLLCTKISGIKFRAPLCIVRSHSITPRRKAPAAFSPDICRPFADFQDVFDKVSS